jgi:hypothetical protein
VTVEEGHVEIFLLTVTYLCYQQTPAIANRDGCNGDFAVLLKVTERVAHKDVEGYFVSREGCEAAAAKLRETQAQVEAHIANTGLTDFYRSAHVDCKTQKVQP